MLKKDIAQLLAEDDATSSAIPINADLYVQDQAKVYMRKTKAELDTLLADRAEPHHGNPFGDTTIHYSEDGSESALGCARTINLGESVTTDRNKVTCPACLRARTFDPVTGLRWDSPESLAS